MINFASTVVKFFIISPLEKKANPSFEQLEYSLLKDALSNVWLKLVQMFFQNRFIKANTAFTLHQIISK